MVMANGDGFVAALDTEIDQTLHAEGYARELVNRIQRVRRDIGLEVSDRIRLGIVGSDVLEQAAVEHTEYIAGETLAVEILVGRVEVTALEMIDVEIDELSVAIGIERLIT